MGGRVVECGGLENRCTLTGTGGSNPSPSAYENLAEVDLPLRFLAAVRFSDLLRLASPKQVRRSFPLGNANASAAADNIKTGRSIFTLNSLPDSIEVLRHEEGRISLLLRVKTHPAPSFARFR